MSSRTTRLILVGPEPGRPCGISDYIQALLPAFQNLLPTRFLSYVEALAGERSRVDEALLVHYERSLVPGSGYLKALAVRHPAVFVVPHEVYAEDPFAFPYCQLRASPGFLWLKHWRYRWRHRDFAREVRLQRHGYHARAVFPLNAQARKVLETRCPNHLGTTIALAAMPLPPVSGVPLAPRDFFPAPEPKWILGLFGFLTSANDYGAALDLLADLPDGALLILGGNRIAGRMEDAIRTAAAARGLDGRVAVTGYIPEPRLGDYLALPDAFLFPARFKSSSSSLLRLASLGKPMVAADLPLTRELETAGVPLVFYRDFPELRQRVAEIRSGFIPLENRYPYTPARVAADYVAAIRATLNLNN